MAQEKPFESDSTEAARHEQDRPTGPASAADVNAMSTDELQALVIDLQLRHVELEEALAQRSRELHQRDERMASLSAAVENLAEGVLITSDELDWPEPPIVFANEAMCHITGYRADELIAQSPQILQGEKTDLETLRQIQRELAEGRPFSCELIHYRKDGTPYDTEVYVAPLFNAEGKRTHFVCIHRDMTEVKQAKENLRQEHELSENIFRNSSDIVLLLDNEGNIRHFNPAMERLTGWQLNEVQGRNWFETFLPERERQPIRRVFDRALTGESTRANVNSIVARGGQERLIEWCDAPLTAADGELVGLLCTGRDITEQQEAELALRQSEERLRAVLNTAADAIITIDNAGVIKGVNPATEAMFGYEEDELIGRNVSMLMPPPYCDEHDGYIARYLETGEARIIGSGREVEGRRRDGTVFPIDLAISQIDHLGLYTGIIRDITERKAAQERLIQSERLASLGEAMAGLTHESRNALARCQGNLRRLSRRLKGKGELLTMIEGAWRANDDIRRQFDEVRDYAAPMHLNCESLELSELVQRVWDDLKPERENRQAELVVNGRDMDLNCVADSFALRNVFRNLFDNALAACPDPVAIDIDFREAKIETESAVEIAICDNGPGLSQDVRERAFDAFFTTKTRGTGLGLAIVKRSVEAHGGVVTFGAERDRGAEVIITLPRGSA